jgi:hypothetical protein
LFLNGGTAVEFRWPSGLVENFKDLPTNRFIIAKD